MVRVFLPTVSNAVVVGSVKLPEATRCCPIRFEALGLIFFSSGT